MRNLDFTPHFLYRIARSLFSKQSWKVFAEYVGLSPSAGKAPIATAEQLGEFIRSRASHVAQTSLYGYLKTRAGTRFPEMFEDPGILLSLNMAKWQVWLASVSDLAIYCGALIARRDDIDNEQAQTLLLAVVEDIFQEIGTPHDAADVFDDTAEGVRRRIRNTDLTAVADGEMAFSESPDALYRWAPVADELKILDKLIVKNSVRFRWKEVRAQARRRLPVDANFDPVRF